MRVGTGNGKRFREVGSGLGREGRDGMLGKRDFLTARWVGDQGIERAGWGETPLRLRGGSTKGQQGDGEGAGGEGGGKTRETAVPASEEEKRTGGKLEEGPAEEAPVEVPRYVWHTQARPPVLFPPFILRSLSHSLAISHSSLPPFPVPGALLGRRSFNAPSQHAQCSRLRASMHACTRASRQGC